MAWSGLELSLVRTSGGKNAKGSVRASLNSDLRILALIGESSQLQVRLPSEMKGSLISFDRSEKGKFAVSTHGCWPGRMESKSL